MQKQGRSEQSAIFTMVYELSDLHPHTINYCKEQILDISAFGHPAAACYY